MNMKDKIRLAVTMLLLGTLVSCNSWLDVKPEDRIMDDELFKDKDGYMIALNGIYSELNGTSLYGRNLTVGMIDVMAQYYNCSVAYHNFSLYMDYSYGQSSYKARFENIWLGLYSLIANCNAIIGHCGNGNSVLSDVYYNMIKGEAIGLRAMMHLDLLRMFGPIWSDTGKDVKCMPYMTRADRAVEPLLTADSVMWYIIKDLETASSLLSVVDPVITEGAKNYDSGVGANDMNYRQYRMNYFAVNALIARAYLWSGNKEKAGEYARMVIEQVNKGSDPLFPLVDATYMGANSDRMFSPEVLFSLYNTSRKSVVYDVLFTYSLSTTSILSMAGKRETGRISITYDDENDYRYKMWESTVVNNTEVTYLTKFKDETRTGAEAYRYMMPLIRMSELYLIAAECETDVQKALDNYFNPLRFSRNCVNQNAIDEDALKNLIRAEYVREFIGEGQLFFYYKRNGLQNIPDGATVSSVKSMSLDSYVFPLPDGETSQRAN